MKTRIHYAGEKGSVELVAEAIARVAKQPKEKLPPAYQPENITLIFLGCEDKGGKPDKEVITFLSSMNNKRIQHVALFGTSPKKDTRFIDEMRKLVEARGIKVLAETFVCQGKGGLFAGGKDPVQSDLDAAAVFAQRAMDSIKTA